MNGTLITACVLLAALLLGWGMVRARTTRAASALPPEQECDDELREVFLAEVRSALANLRRDLAQWRAAPDTLEYVIPLRRCFHTLKGSGLLVGAVELGQLSGKIERLLLRVIERELAPRAEVIDVVESASAVLPSLVAEFAGEGRGGNTKALNAAVERLLRLPAKVQRVPVRSHLD